MKIAFGDDFPGSNRGRLRLRVGLSAETTTPQTVAVSPMWPAATVLEVEPAEPAEGLGGEGAAHRDLQRFRKPRLAEEK